MAAPRQPLTIPISPTAKAIFLVEPTQNPIEYFAFATCFKNKAKWKGKYIEVDIEGSLPPELDVHPEDGSSPENDPLHEWLSEYLFRLAGKLGHPQSGWLFIAKGQVEEVEAKVAKQLDDIQKYYPETVTFLYPEAVIAQPELKYLANDAESKHYIEQLLKTNEKAIANLKANPNQEQDCKAIMAICYKGTKDFQGMKKQAENYFKAVIGQEKDGSGKLVCEKEEMLESKSAYETMGVINRRLKALTDFSGLLNKTLVFIREVEKRKSNLAIAQKNFSVAYELLSSKRSGLTTTAGLYSTSPTHTLTLPLVNKEVVSSTTSLTSESSSASVLNTTVGMR